MYTHKIISIYFLPENSFWSRVDCVPIGILSWMTSPSSHHPGHPVLLCNLCWLVNWMSLCRLGHDHLSLVSSSLYHEVFLSRPRGRNLLNWMSADHVQWWYRLQSLSSLIKHLKKRVWCKKSSWVLLTVQCPGQTPNFSWEEPNTKWPESIVLTRFVTCEPPKFEH